VTNEILLVVLTFLKTHRVIGLYAKSIATKQKRKKAFQEFMVGRKHFRSLVLKKKKSYFKKEIF